MSEEKKQGLGIGPYKIPVALYQKNREKLMARMSAVKHEAKEGDAAAVLLEGGKDMLLYDTDRELLFRQESYFYYLFGLNEPNCYGVLDLAKKESLLFIPRYSADYEVWCGKAAPPAVYAKQYGVDHVHFVDELVAVLTERKIGLLYALYGFNSDSKAHSKKPQFEGMDKFKVDFNLLHPEITECRVIKSDLEADVLRYIVGLSSQAHMSVMRSVRSGMYEYQLEAMFKHYTLLHGGARYDAYTCICGSGENGAALHYGHAGAPNSKKIGDNDMLLLDMGSEYHGYCSDITCSYPSSGKFSKDQRAVYEAVWAAQKAVMGAMKPGVKWTDMHRLAERTILEHLVQMGIVQLNGKSLDDLHKLHIPAVFMPHGLGHLLGLDTHDVGGYPKGVERIQEPGICCLRTARELQPGMVLTVEPGLYFIDALLDRALQDAKQAPHINNDVLKRFRGFGGVRLEDDVLVTRDGCENLTKVPRAVEEVEKIMAEGRKE